MVSPKNKYKKDKNGHIQGEIRYKAENPFNVLKKWRRSNAEQ